MALAAVLAFVVSGCGFMSAGPSGGGKGKSPIKRINVTTPFTATQTVQPGTTFGPADGAGNSAVANQIVKGTFSSTLPFKLDISLKGKKGKKGSASAAAGKLKQVSGSFISRLEGTFNFFTGAGTFKGIKVLRFGQGSLGEACLSWTSNVTTTGASTRSETGTFTYIGGTKLSARARGGGTYSSSQSQTGTTASVTGSITIQGKLGKPAKAPDAACKALSAQLP